MTRLQKVLSILMVNCLFTSASVFATASPNQTDDTTPILSEADLPFTIKIEQANFQLGVGNHSGFIGTFKGLWVIVAGSTIGLHGFGPDPFPPGFQNTTIYVVNPSTGVTYSRSLLDPSSGLTTQQIDTLSTISPQGYQEGNTLYLTGGYGKDSLTGLFLTQPVLTAINLPGIVDWVTQPGTTNQSVAGNIRQLTDPLFQVTGGEMYKVGDYTQLVFGQNFSGVYDPNTSNGIYTEQVRLFKIIDAGGNLAVKPYNSKPAIPAPVYRRRDLNIVPVLYNNNNLLNYGLVAYSGVFTEDGGVWTVPVLIDDQGSPSMADPLLESTFKQGMNNYVCPVAGLYSKNTSSMYDIFFGGISYGYYDNGVFTTDEEDPFINQVTTVKMDKNGSFSQYLMNNQYPSILSSNTQADYLFGAGAYFIPNNISQYPNKVINLDGIRQPTVIGYIVGGIQSELPNLNDPSTQSLASRYVFKVTLIPKTPR